MIRPFAHALALPLLVFAAPALAHTGHVAEEAGHSHFLGIWALAAVGVIAVAAFARTRVARRREAALNG
jgi:hypothetical protein